MSLHLLCSQIVADIIEAGEYWRASLCDVTVAALDSGGHSTDWRLEGFGYKSASSEGGVDS